MEYKVMNIKGFEGLYYIFEDGKVYTLRKKQFMKVQHNNKLYKYCMVFLSGHEGVKAKWFFVHRLVALHFIGPCPPGCEINHIDMNRSHNHWSNLEWISHSQNMINARKIKPWKGGRNKGFTHLNSTKQLMREKKYKKVLLINDNEQVILPSIEEFCKQFNTYRKKYTRLVNTHRTFNGFYVRTIQ